MKRYKLVKDLPTFELGDEFILKEGIGLQHVIEGCDGAIVYTEATLDKFPNILTDWFEEINESTRWKPERLRDYYYVSSSGAVYDDVWNDTPNIDHDRFDIGNCFQTKEEAEQVVEYLKALAVVRGDATTKFVKGDRNWFVYFDTERKSPSSTCTFYISSKGIFGLPYFATEEDAQRSIETHRKEWLTIFGVKEEE